MAIVNREINIMANFKLPMYFSNVNEFAEIHLKDKIDTKHNGLFDKKQIQWFNLNMKNLASSVRKKLIEKYTVQDKSNDLPKRTDINILLNRVKLNQKNESRKKIYFSAAASAGLFLFGLIIF